MFKNKNLSLFMWLVAVFGSAGLLSVIGMDANAIAAIYVGLFVLILIAVIIIISRLGSTLSAGVISGFLLIAFILRPTISRQNRPLPGELPSDYYKFISNDWLNAWLGIALFAACGWLVVSLFLYGRLSFSNIIRVKETTEISKEV